MPQSFFLKRPRLRAIGLREHMWDLEQGKCMSDSGPSTCQLRGPEQLSDPLELQFYYCKVEMMTLTSCLCFSIWHTVGVS